MPKPGGDGRSDNGYGVHGTARTCGSCPVEWPSDAVKVRGAPCGGRPSPADRSYRGRRGLSARKSSVQ